MKFISIILFSTLSISNSYSQDIQDSKSSFANKIIALPEFNKALNIIDSLFQTGIKIELSFEIIWDVPTELEPEERIAWAYINQILFETIDDTLYFIKYDKKEEKIILLEKRREPGIEN